MIEREVRLAPDDAAENGRLCPDCGRLVTRESKSGYCKTCVIKHRKRRPSAPPDIDGMRQCRTCGRAFPATPEYFYRDRGSLERRCKACASAAKNRGRADGYGQKDRRSEKPEKHSVRQPARTVAERLLLCDAQRACHRLYANRLAKRAKNAKGYHQMELRRRIIVHLWRAVKLDAVRRRLTA